MRKTYLSHLFKISKLNDSDLSLAMRLSGEIGSEFELNSVMSKLVKIHELDFEDLWLDYFASTESIGSDFELAKVMIAANKHIDQASAGDQVFNAYRDLATHIGSGFEMKKVYTDLLNHDIHTQHLERMIDAAGQHIASDFELASLLLRITQQQRVNESIKSRIKAAVITIGSDFERKRVLAAIS